jgi:hypothetical protein
MKVPGILPRARIIHLFLVSNQDNALLCGGEEHGVNLDRIWVALRLEPWLLTDLSVNLAEKSGTDDICLVIFEFFNFAKLLFNRRNPEVCAFECFPEDDSHLLVLVKQRSEEAAARCPLSTHLDRVNRLVEHGLHIFELFKQLRQLLFNLLFLALWLVDNW